MAPVRTYTKVARAAAEDLTRTALLDAAEAAFLSARWSDVSIAALAERAGVSKQTLLRQFGSKDELLEHAFLRTFEVVRTQRLDTATDLPGAIDSLLDFYTEWGIQGLKIGATEGEGLIADIGRQCRQLHYDWVDRAFASWLQAAPAIRRRRLRAALIAVCDVQAWWILTHDLGLDRAEVRATLLLAVEQLLDAER